LAAVLFFSELMKDGVWIGKVLAILP